MVHGHRLGKWAERGPESANDDHVTNPKPSKNYVTDVENADNYFQSLSAILKNGRCY